MQPYFFPYIGYFQLISAVDTFVVYDNIKYTKKGWINRNRYLMDGNDSVFSLPLKKDSESLDVKERSISSDFNREKLLNQIKEAYRAAPFFEETYMLFEKIIRNDEINLFKYIYYSMAQICSHLKINTSILISSDVKIDHSLRNQEKVIAICKSLGASTYINAIGGQDLYMRDGFLEKNVELKFIKSHMIEYSQFGRAFVPWLSILDVMMFNSVQKISEFLDEKYELV